MATNQVYDVETLSLACSDPATPNSGDAVRYGALTGVALTDEDAAGLTSVHLGLAVWNLPVKGEAAAILVGDALFYDDGISAVSNDSTNGFFFGFALGAVNNGATTTIRVLHTPSPGAGVLGSAVVGSAQLASAAVTAVKIAADILKGDKVAETANGEVLGALPIVYRIDITAGALGNTDVTITNKTRVIDAWLVLRGAGVATTTLQVFNGASAISDAMAASGADKALVRAASLDDAAWEIADSGTLRVTSATGATQPAATVYVKGIRVA